MGPSNLTLRELLRLVDNTPDSTPLERELASRAQRLWDQLELAQRAYSDELERNRYAEGH